MIFSGFCLFFCEDKTTIWCGVRQSYYPFLSSPCWKCQFEVVIWKKSSSSLSRADVCGLGKAWRQIYGALPVPPHQIFWLFCHFFYFKTLTKVNCNLFCSDGPVAAAASCSVHMQASCCSFAFSSIRRRFIHLDSQSLYHLLKNK